MVKGVKGATLIWEQHLFHNSTTAKFTAHTANQRITQVINLELCKEKDKYMYVHLKPLYEPGLSVSEWVYWIYEFKLEILSSSYGVRFSQLVTHSVALVNKWKLTGSK